MMSSFHNKPTMYPPQQFPLSANTEAQLPVHITQQLYGQNKTNNAEFSHHWQATVNQNSVPPHLIPNDKSYHHPLPSLSPMSQMPPYPHPQQPQAMTSHDTMNYPHPQVGQEFPQSNFPNYTGQPTALSQTLTPSYSNPNINNLTQNGSAGLSEGGNPTSYFDTSGKQSTLPSFPSSSRVDMHASKYVKRLMQETDQSRKRSKCELQIENVQETISDLDEEMNLMMMERDDDFIESNEFKDLSRRKKNLMKDLRALKEFLSQMDDQMEEETQVVKVTPFNRQQYLQQMKFQNQQQIKQEIFYPPPDVEQPNVAKKKEATSNTSIVNAHTSANQATNAEEKIMNIPLENVRIKCSLIFNFFFLVNLKENKCQMNALIN